MSIRKVVASAKIPVSGRRKLIVRDASLNAVHETDWHKNLMTGAGLDWLLTNGATPNVVCVAGTGNDAPSISDTTLATYAGKMTSLLSSATTYQTSSSPYYMRVTYTFRFNPGAFGSGSHNIAETGIIFGTQQSSVTGATTVHNRSRVVDGVGDPTTVAVNTDTQYLDVVAEITFWLADSGTQTISADIKGTPTATDYVARPARLGVDSGLGGSSPNWGFGWSQFSSDSYGRIRGFAVDGGVEQAYATYVTAGEIQGASQDITGTYSVAMLRSTHAAGGYTAGAYSRKFTYTWGPSNGNVEISAVQVNRSMGCWQFSLDPAIPKTSDDMLQVEIEISLANA